MLEKSEGFNMSEHWTDSESSSNIVGFTLVSVVIFSMFVIFTSIRYDIRTHSELDSETASTSFECDEEILDLFFDDFEDEDIF